MASLRSGLVGVYAFALFVAVWPGARPGFAHVAIDGQIEDLSRRIRQEPRNAALHLRRGELHRAERDWPAALADYRSARRLDPGLDAVDLCLARMHLDAGRPEEARRFADLFLAQKPRHVDALLTRARAEAKLGERVPAADDFSRAIDLARPPRPEHFLERARVLGDAGPEHFDRALQGLDEGMARLGPVITLELAAIDLELRALRHDAALRRVDAILARWPRKELWLARRGEILEQAGRHSEAHEAFAAARQALESLPPPRRKARLILEAAARIDAALLRLAGEEQ